jgi:O-antigen ligase
MREYPLLGAGPDHFPLISEEFGWPEGKEAHSLWLQLGAEVGIPGLVVLLLFYFMTIWRMWSYCRVVPTNEDERWTQTARAMIVTSLAGFMTSAQFVSLEGLETPLYVAAIALGTLRLVTARQVADSTALNPAPVTVRSMPSAAGAGFSVPSPAPAGSTSRPLWPHQ